MNNYTDRDLIELACRAPAVPDWSRAVRNVTRRRLSAMTARLSGRTNVECRAVINEFFNVVVTAATLGRPVVLKGAMTFYTLTRAQQSARNPRTGELVIVPERRVLRCRFRKEAV